MVFWQQDYNKNCLLSKINKYRYIKVDKIAPYSLFFFFCYCLVYYLTFLPGKGGVRNTGRFVAHLFLSLTTTKKLWSLFFASAFSSAEPMEKNVMKFELVGGKNYLFFTFFSSTLPGSLTSFLLLFLALKKNFFDDLPTFFFLARVEIFQLC